MDGTQVVLYPGGPDEVRARWSLHGNDFVSFGAGFPNVGGSPEAVIRLRKLQPAGGAETFHESRLRLQGVSGRGDIAFDVGDDYSPFEAELGLANRDGGWLLLARSNRLQHATGIGLAALSLPRRRPLAPATATAELAPLQRAAPSADPQSGAPAAAPIPGGTPLPARDPTIVEPAEILGVPEPRAPGFVNPAYPRPRPQHDGGRAPPEPAPTSSPDRDRNATPAAVPIPTMIYGERTPSATGLVVEAELHVRGWATPNSEIDLFGHKYFVGPGGRFELVLRVDDPDLLRQALSRGLPASLASRSAD